MRLLRVPSHHRRSVNRRRSGFSLIEVILATAILLGSVSILSQLLGMGRTLAQQSRLHAQAQRLCENTVGEIVLGLRPLTPMEAVPLRAVQDPPVPEQFEEEVIEEDSLLASPRRADRLSGRGATRWLYSLRTRPHRRVAGVLVLTVEVMEARPVGSQPVRYSLTRWVQAPEGFQGASSRRLSGNDLFGDGAPLNADGFGGDSLQ